MKKVTGYQPPGTFLMVDDEPTISQNGQLREIIRLTQERQAKQKRRLEGRQKVKEFFKSLLIMSRYGRAKGPQR